MSKESDAAVTIRKAPKYLTFLLSGFVLGVILALIAGLAALEIVGLLIVIGGVSGGGLGILLALGLDIFYRGRGRKLVATKITE